jgi:hypothetical protein
MARRSIVRQMAQETSRHVLLESTRAAIEKMAEEFAKDALADPEFRAYLRAEATSAAREIARSLRGSIPRRRP